MGLVGVAAYGAGNHFTASVASATDLPRPVDRIAYFGDVDAQGLAIPVRAGMVAATMGLPRIEPAGALYELLFVHGRPAVHGGASMGALDAENRVAWLPAHLRPAAARLLGEGKRLAQEWVCFELLECDVSWLGRL